MSRVNYVKSQLRKYQLCYDTDSQAQFCQFQLCKYQLCARPNKWPEMVVKQSFRSQFHFESEYTYIHNVSSQAHIHN